MLRYSKINLNKSVITKLFIMYILIFKSLKLYTIIYIYIYIYIYISETINLSLNILKSGSINKKLIFRPLWKKKLVFIFF